MTIRFEAVIPILRIFSIEKAREFYQGWLGFDVDWEHRFDDTAPVYMQISRGGLVLHLSEHHGDCSPGAAVVVQVSGLEALHQELEAKGYAFMRPGLEEVAWGKVMEVIDPFGNRIRFNEPPGPT